MSAQKSENSYPKLHNAMWPGLVGKGSPGAEPCIDLDTMLDLTAAAEVNGTRFDGVDLFLFDPHVSIDIEDEELKRLADKITSRGFVVGSVVAPVWPPTGGGSAMGTAEERKSFLGQLRKACRIASGLRKLGVRPYGVVRIDSACGVTDWAKDPEANQAAIADTFKQACDIAEDFGERLAAEGEICWGGMHSWRKMLDLLNRVDRPNTLGFQADMAHTLLYVMGYNAPEDAILPPEWDWSDPDRLDKALQTVTKALRPWTIDFHVAQNDATVHGSGTHDKTGHHCLPDDPQGKLSIAKHAGYWLRDHNGKPTRAVQHICWDGCMFSNEVMMKQETWNKILQAMIAVRNAHGWEEPAAPIKLGNSVQNRSKSVAAKGKARTQKKTTPAKKAGRTKKVASARKGVTGKKAAGFKGSKKAVSARKSSGRVSAKKAIKAKSRKARTARKKTRPQSRK